MLEICTPFEPRNAILHILTEKATIVACSIGVLIVGGYLNHGGLDVLPVQRSTVLPDEGHVDFGHRHLSVHVWFLCNSRELGAGEPLRFLHFRCKDGTVI